MRAKIAGHEDIDGEKVAVRVEREAPFGNDIASLIVGQKRLRPVAGPFDRAADLTGRPGHHHLFGIDIVEEPEAAADIVGDGAHLFGRDPKARCDGIFDSDRPLAAGQNRIKSRGLVIGPDRGARFQVGGRDALVTKGLCHHEVRGRQRFAHGRPIPECGSKGDVTGGLVMQQWCVRSDRRQRVGDGRQFMIANDDLLARVPCKLRGLGDHHGDRLAGKPCAFGRKRQVWQFKRGPPSVPRERPLPHVIGGSRVGHMANADSSGRSVVRGREDRDDARQRRGGCGVDSLDPGMGVRRSHERRINLPVKVKVIRETSAAPDQPAVLEARQRPPDIGFVPRDHHRCPSPVCGYAYSNSQTEAYRDWHRRRRFDPIPIRSAAAPQDRCAPATGYLPFSPVGRRIIS